MSDILFRFADMVTSTQDDKKKDESDSLFNVQDIFQE